MKCNTKSSTETELISFANKLADIILMQYFIECQGYNIDEYVVFQDNMSALLLEKIGRGYPLQNAPNTSKPNISLPKSTMILGKLMLKISPPMKCGLMF